MTIFSEPAPKRCDSCGTVVPATAAYCHECGLPTVNRRETKSALSRSTLFVITLVGMAALLVASGMAFDFGRSAGYERGRADGAASEKKAAELAVAKAKKESYDYGMAMGTANRPEPSETIRVDGRTRLRATGYRSYYMLAIFENPDPRQREYAPYYGVVSQSPIGVKSLPSFELQWWRD